MLRSALGDQILSPFQFIETRKGRLVLLFYDGFEWRARETLGDRAAAQFRRGARHAYRTLRGTQVFTGYYSSFRALRQGLEDLGCDVRVNDFATARRHPFYPIGLAGYPSVLKAVLLPNPVLFGPGDFGDPQTAATVAREPRIRFLIRAGEWLRQMYVPSCGEKVVTWPSAIDTDRWLPSAKKAKAYDVLIYDKIYHEREELLVKVLEPLQHHLQSLSLSYAVVRYGEHHEQDYFKALSKSRSLAFLSHHETQGRAYLEAMSCGLPVFAWDQGRFMDACLAQNMPQGVEVSSVPYFDERCGTRFKIGDVEPKFDQFWRDLDSFRPREFVLENFSLKARAESYLSIYSRAGVS